MNIIFVIKKTIDHMTLISMLNKAVLVLLSLTAICLSIPIRPTLPDSYEAELAVQAITIIGSTTYKTQSRGHVGFDYTQKKEYSEYKSDVFANGNQYNVHTISIARYDMTPAKLFRLTSVQGGQWTCTVIQLNDTMVSFNDFLKIADCLTAKQDVDGHTVKFCTGNFSHEGVKAHVKLGIEQTRDGYVPYIAYESIPASNVTETAIYHGFNNTTPDPDRYPFDTIPNVCNKILYYKS